MKLLPRLPVLLGCLLVLPLAGCGGGGGGGSSAAGGGGSGGTAGDLSSIADTYHEISGTVDRSGSSNTVTIQLARAGSAATVLGWYTEKAGATVVANHGAFGVLSGSTWHFAVSEKTVYAMSGASSNLIHFTASADILGAAGTAVALADGAISSGSAASIALTFTGVQVVKREAWSGHSLGAMALVATDRDDTGTTFASGLEATWELIALGMSPTTGPSYTSEAHWLVGDTDTWTQTVASTRVDAAAETVAGYFFSDAEGKRAFVGMRTDAAGAVSLGAFTVRSDSGGRRRFGGYFLDLATGTLSTTYYLAAVAAGG